MTAEEFFRMAVKLVEANIRSGQYVDSRDMSALVHNQVTATFQGLGAAWDEISADNENVH